MADHNGTPPAGPLTTVFTPVPSCAAHTDGLYWISTCMMEGWESYSTASYFSPGICPSGQTSAGPVPSDFGPPLEPTETGIMCCQSGLTLTSLDSATLLFQFPVTEPFFYFCHTEDPAITPSIRYNYAIQVRWAESDYAVLETDPLNPGQPPPTAGAVVTTPAATAGVTAGADEQPGPGDQTGTAGQTGQTGTTSRNASGDGTPGGDPGGNGGGGDTSNSGSGGLAPGAIAGIVIALVLVTLGLAIGLFFFLRKRRRRSQTLTTTPLQMASPKLDPAFLRPERSPSIPPEYFAGPAELPGSMFFEERAELP